MTNTTNNITASNTSHLSHTLCSRESSGPCHALSDNSTHHDFSRETYTISSTKTHLRKYALTRRTVDVTHELLATAGQSIATHAMQWHTLQQAHTVALYIAMGTEIPTATLIHTLLAAGKQVLVPRLGTGMEIGWSYMAMDSALLAPAASWRPQEPDTTILPAETLKQADVIFTAGLAVDQHGTRLGRGGGWYDRALQYRNHHAPIIALLWPWEIHQDSTLPQEPHDIPVQGALSPDGLQLFANIDA